jgi:hypothetical protein
MATGQLLGGGGVPKNLGGSRNLGQGGGNFFWGGPVPPCGGHVWGGGGVMGLSYNEKAGFSKSFSCGSGARKSPFW